MKERLEFAERVARAGGALALEFFSRLGDLAVENKGPQDFVTEADRSVERLIREAIAQTYPDDSILGEEYGQSNGTSGRIWVLDPIDGTANFITNMPTWCVSIACFEDGAVIVGATFAPVTNEMFLAGRGLGATLNGRAISVRHAEDLETGAVGIGFPGGPSGKTSARAALRFCSALVERGGVFLRNGSGALLLAHVAAGRQIAGVEPHMNSWDCLAGLLIVEEAGGRILPFNGDAILADGTRVIASAPGIYDQLTVMCEEAFAGLPAGRDATG